MSATDQPSEEEMRAAYEAELKRIRVEQILLEQVVTLINLGMRRTGLQPGTEDERDPEQVRVAIEAVRALMPLVEDAAGPQAGAIREAVSQMQLAYVRLGGQAPAGPAGPGGPESPGEPGPPPPSASGPGSEPAPPPPSPGQEPGEPGHPGDPGPAQRSGRLWVPGQP
jgi:hypothetical protein